MDCAIHALIDGGCNKLIPSFFFNAFTVSDTVKEPLGMLSTGARAGGASTASWNTSNQYLVDFITRYGDSPAIAAWEIGNEWNLLCDIDQSTLCVACNPPGGTPSFRTRADNISTSDWMVISAGWASTIRAADPLHRPITSGHAVARPAAEHLRASYYAAERDWTNDTFDEFSTNFADIHASIDWASVHLYPGPDALRWNMTGNDTSAELLLWAQAAADKAGKARGKPLPIYVGEFGQVAADPSQQGAPRPFIDSLLGLLAATESGTPPGQVPQPGVAGSVALATIWVWELASQNSSYALWPGVTDGVIQSVLDYNAGK